MKCTKMHGIGNDYVYVHGFEVKYPQWFGKRYPSRQ
jgi:diaminopimelate epimerase